MTHLQIEEIKDLVVQAGNEGHIKVKMSAKEPITINQGQAFMQGIIVPFLKVDDDNCIKNRNGGFGSTDN